jgi:hypothetical protein
MARIKTSQYHALQARSMKICRESLFFGAKTVKSNENGGILNLIVLHGLKSV